MMRTFLKSRFKQNSKLWIATICWCLFALQATAQTSPILTIDLDRLFSETQLGAETLARLEQEAQQLASENSEIESALIKEEQQLTDQRPELEPEAFRTLADDFDQRVQQFRAEQDEKVRALNRSRDDARKAFFSDVAATISNIVREKGALVVVERRDVFLSADSIDITDEAILRVNEANAPAE